MDRAEEARCVSIKMKGDHSGQIKWTIQMAKEAIYDLVIRATVVAKQETAFKKCRFLQKKNLNLRERLREVTERLSKILQEQKGCG